MWWLRNRLRSCKGPSLCLKLLAVIELLELGSTDAQADSSGGVQLVGGEFDVEATDGTSLASEFLRAGVSDGLDIAGVAGVEEKT